MPSAPGLPGDGVRRYLFAAGTSTYRHAAPLPEVEAGLTALTALFKELGYECAHDPPLHNPTTDQLRDALGEWFTGPERRRDDVVVVHYSGHGVVTDQHYLLASDSNADRLARTALPAADLPRLIWPMNAEGKFPPNAPTRVLLLIDACFSGQGADDLAGVAGRLLGAMTEKRDFRDQPVGLWVLTCARPKQEADPGAFVGALADVLDKPQHGGSTQPYLYNFEGLTGSVNRLFQAAKRRHRAGGSVPLVNTDFVFFPNRRYEPDLPLGMDLESQRRHDWKSHWEHKARGVEVAGQAGSYFSGRGAVLRRLVAWLASTDPRACVVVGRPGSGKSAVLARLVTQSVDPPAPGAAAADTVPLPGSVDVAVHARGKNLQQVIRQIAAATGVTADSSALLPAALAEQARPHVVLVDALNESLEPGPIGKLLADLATALPTVRVVVGTQRPALRAFPPSACVVLDLDAEYHEQGDVAEYVKRRLVAEPDSPYRGDPDQAGPLAAEVAARAGHSFLVAQIISRVLIRQPPGADPEAWRELSAGDLDAAFRQDLARFGEQRERVRDLLAPLAWAEGRGLPWEGLWAPLAAAISGREYKDGDVEWLIDAAGGYVVEDRERGYSVYRSYHDQFADFLRDERRAAEIPRRITAVLLDAVPRRPDGTRDWASALPYIRTHLATHAAQAGALDELLADAGYLIAADPERLVRQLHTARGATARAHAKCYRRVAHHLSGATPPARAQYLLLSALQCGAADLTAALRPLAAGARWDTRVAWFKPPVASRVLANFAANPDAACLVADHPGGPRLWVATEHTGHEFDVETGEETTRLALPAVPVRMAAFGGPRPCLVVADTHGSLWVLDAATNEVLGHRPRAHPHIRSLAVAPGVGERPPRVWTGGASGTVRVHSLPVLEFVREINAHQAGVDHLGPADVAGRALVVTCSDSYRDGQRAEHAQVRFWDAADGSLIHEFVGQSGDETRWFAVVRLPDHWGLLVYYYPHSLLYLFDATTGTLLAEPAKVAQQPFACVARPDGVVTFNGESGEYSVTRIKANSTPLRGAPPYRLVPSAGAQLRAGSWYGPVTIGGRVAAVSVAAEVRVWEVEELLQEASAAHELAVGQVDASGEPLFALAAAPSGGHFAALSRLGNFRVWNADGTSVHVRQVVTSLDHMQNAFEHLCLLDDGDAALVVTGTPREVRALRLDGTPAFPPLAVGGRVDALTCARVDGRPLAFVGVEHANPEVERYSVVRIWDLETGEEFDSAAAHLPGYTPPPKARWAFGITGREHKGIAQVCVGEVAGYHILAAASGPSYNTVAVWDWPTKEHLWTQAMSAKVAALVLHGPNLVGGGTDGEIRVWDAATGEEVARASLRTRVAGLVSLRVGTRDLLLSAHGNGRLIAWSEGYEPLDEFDIGESVTALAALSDQRLAVATDRGFVIVRFSL